MVMYNLFLTEADNFEERYEIEEMLQRVRMEIESTQTVCHIEFKFSIF